MPEEHGTLSEDAGTPGGGSNGDDGGRAGESGGWTDSLREIMASGIAVVIVALTVWMLFKVFVLGGKADADPEAYARQKDIMLYGLTLLGTILGYYFGRVPAERRAEQAEEVAGNAQTAAAQAGEAAGEAQRQAREEAAKKEAAEAKVADARSTVERIRNELPAAPRKPAGTRGGGGRGAPAEAPDSAAGARSELEALLRRLG